MGMGTLKVEVRTADNQFPIKGATINIINTNGEQLYSLTSNANGLTNQVELYAPPASLSETPYAKSMPFAIYLVEVFAQGYKDVYAYGVQVFDQIDATLPVIMQPALPSAPKSANTTEIYIPIEHGVSSNVYNSDVTKSFQDGPNSPYILANEVKIPEFITVHLGSPTSSAENVRVAFVDYIKNVASSEIYPTWDEDALYANIYAQISYALNRIYTVWYRSRGYNFDITSSTAYDQFFVYGRDIFDNISNIVDGIFNDFIRREGRAEPFFAQYCNGTTVTCDGMSQWGSQDLAKQGYTPIEILRYYYPNDIQIVESNNFSQTTETYPGAPLKEGMNNEDIQLMQTYLNRISANYPLIPKIPNPNGYFDSTTTEAVKVFQKIANLPVDGIIGKETWYAITRYYVAVKRLAELDSEGERIGIGTTPPTSVIKRGSRGEDVVELQFLLNYIAQFYPSIPPVIEDSIFGESTELSVIAFQKEFGLVPDGIVGPATWKKLYEVYWILQEDVVEPPVIDRPQYPGTPLQIGSTGANVALMQEMLLLINSKYICLQAGAADGIFGSQTERAVRMFQLVFGLEPTGIIDETTWNAIVDVYYQLFFEEE